MESLKLFLKENKIKKDNVHYKATLSLLDEEGEAVLWELRRISTREDEKIREECVSSNAKGMRTDYNLYMKKMAAACVVNPPLFNAQLQDSYNVKSPEDLLTALIDNPGEYQEFIKFVQKLNGFDVTMSERVEKAKN